MEQWERLRRTGHMGAVGGRTAVYREDFMIWAIAMVLIVLWLLGLVSAYTMGGFIHILLVVAIIMILVRLIEGRRPVA